MAAVIGIQKVVRSLRKAEKDYDRAVAGSLYAEGQAIMAQSVKQVPVDTGRLRQSAYVTRPRAGEHSPVVTLGYGTKYALAVHERTEVRHAVGKAKYLEDPINAARSGYTARVGDRARRMYARGQGMDTVPAAFPQRRGGSGA